MRRAPNTVVTRLLGTCAALLLGGCFAVNDPSAHQPAPLPPDDFCGRFVDVICSAVRDCTTTCPGTTVDDATCRSVLQIQCANTYGPLTADERTGYDPEEMAVQMAIGADLIADCDPAFWTWANERGGIIEGFAGTVEVGGSCDPLIAGTQDLPRFSSCADEGLCVQPEADGSWSCLAPPGEGEECFRRGCAEGLACQLDGRCGSARAADGEYCLENAGCESSSCQVVGNVGVCLSTQQSYCGLLDNRACALTQIAVAGEGAGPIAPGGTCEQIAVCVQSAQVPDLLERAPRLMCGDASAAPGVGCADQGYDQVCFWFDEGSTATDPVGPGELDLAEVDTVCAITRLDTADARAPTVICFTAP